ncbi:hypothetical protein IC229_05035 [Spirosoma sp. BT702]|uniref:Uncharacterized protein n=1 Tax=Spirosoma profusum TaxID=2771354 RepID=A0A927AQA3_9BACT|nr:hypothetical protein [Spirosoma profusum]MBD2699988.1 hypothetical protein [Spirosoma profusum]
MNPSIQLWTKSQLSSNLNKIEQYLHNACFKRQASFSTLTQSLFIELIRLENELLHQSELTGKRIEFLDEVGTNGRIEDITSLIHNMSQSVHDFDKNAEMASSKEEKIITPHINHFYGAGVGYFANGLFFTCDHEDELAFFVDRNRIFFYRHMVRAYEEAKGYLQSLFPEEAGGPRDK